MSKEINDLDSFQDMEEENDWNGNVDDTIKMQPNLNLNICKLTILDDIDELTQKVFGVSTQNESIFTVEDYSNFKFPQFKSQKKQITAKKQYTGQKLSFNNARVLNQELRSSKSKEMECTSTDQKKQNANSNSNVSTHKQSYFSLNKTNKDTWAKPQKIMPQNKAFKKETNFQKSKEYFGQGKGIYGDNFVQGKIHLPGKTFIENRGNQNQKLLVPTNNTNVKNSPIMFSNQNIYNPKNNNNNFRKPSVQSGYANINVTANKGCTMIMKKVVIDLTADLDQIRSKIKAQDEHFVQRNTQKSILIQHKSSIIQEKGLFGQAIQQKKFNKVNQNGPKRQNDMYKKSQSGNSQGYVHLSTQPTHQQSSPINNNFNVQNTLYGTLKKQNPPRC